VDPKLLLTYTWCHGLIKRDIQRQGPRSGRAVDEGGGECGSWLAVSKMRGQICHVLLAHVVIACGSAYGGKDVKMLHCLVCNNILYMNHGIIKWLYHLLRALGLVDSLRLASLHMFSLGLRVRCHGSPTVIKRLATRLVQH
jgi:hypothetical protein